MPEQVFEEDFERIRQRGHTGEARALERFQAEDFDGFPGKRNISACSEGIGAHWYRQSYQNEVGATKVAPYRYGALPLRGLPVGRSFSCA